MIRFIKRTVVFVLALTILMQESALAVERTPHLQHSRILISDGTTKKVFEILLSDDDVYFQAESFALLAHCGIEKNGNQCSYCIGEKKVNIDFLTGELEVELLGVGDSVGNIITENEAYFISASKLLPWLNVICDVTEEGILQVVPDKNSLWRIRKDIYTGDCFFDTDTLWGDSLFNKASLELIINCDAVINFRFERLIPAFTWQEFKENPKSIIEEVVGAAVNGGTNNIRIFKNHSLYDYMCYVEEMSEFGVMDGLTSKAVQENVDDYLEAGSSLNDISTYFQDYIDQVEADDNTVRRMNDTLSKLESASEFRGRLDNLATIATDDDLILSVQDMLSTWKDAVKWFKDYKTVHDYFDIFAALKVIEISVRTDNDYRAFVNWCNTQETGNRLLDKAVKSVSNTLNEDYTVYNAYSAMAKKALYSFSSGMTEGALGDAAIYIKAAKLLYNFIFPGANEGFEGIAKWNIYESMQNCFVRLSERLMSEPMTKENIMHIRQSLIVALKCSRECYNGLEKTANASLFGFLKVFGGGQTGAVYQIDELIMRLYASCDNTENDSIEEKDAYSRRLVEQFSELRYISSESLVVEYSAYTHNIEYLTSGSLPNGEDIVDWHIPFINLAGENVTSINETLMSYEYSKIQHDLNKNGYNYNTASYEWAVNGNILSLVFRFVTMAYASDVGTGVYQVYNISVDSGEDVSNAELLAQKGLSEEEYYELIRRALGSSYWQSSGMIDSLQTDTPYGRSSIEEFNYGLEKTLDNENILSSVPYLNSAGQICIIGSIYAWALEDYFSGEYNLEDFTFIDNYSQFIEIPDYSSDNQIDQAERISEDEAYQIACNYWNYTEGDVDEETKFELYLVSDGLQVDDFGREYYEFRMRWLVVDEDSPDIHPHLSTVDFLKVDAYTGECVGIDGI